MRIGLSTVDAEQDVLTLENRQAAFPRAPIVRNTRPELTVPDHQADHWGGTADLATDVDERPALGFQSERHLFLCIGQVSPH
jgi:hypothetical protein